MEVLLKTNTMISESDKEIDTSDTSLDDEVATTVTLTELFRIQNFQRITTDIKVIDNMEPVYVSGGKKKQEVLIADHSGTAKLTLWRNMSILWRKVRATP